MVHPAGRARPGASARRQVDLAPVRAPRRNRRGAPRSFAATPPAATVRPPCAACEGSASRFVRSVAMPRRGLDIEVAGRGVRWPQRLTPACWTPAIPAAPSGCWPESSPAHPFPTSITGDDSLRRRPMRRIIVPLERMGARVTSDDGRPPLTIEGTSPAVGHRLRARSTERPGQERGAAGRTACRRRHLGPGTAADAGSYRTRAACVRCTRLER